MFGLERKLGIIGTAGRGDDKLKLNKGYWNLMKIVSGNLITIFEPTHLVSGGAAYSDHLAIHFFHSEKMKAEIHFPCGFDNENFQYEETKDRFDPGKTSNYYHREFSKVCEIDSLNEIKNFIESDRTNWVRGNGFKERNTTVAKQSDFLLAFTFGEGKELKDGGTADTVKKYLALGKKHCYHFNLNDKKLYKL